MKYGADLWAISDLCSITTKESRRNLYKKGTVSYTRTDSRYLPSSLKVEATRIAHAIADRSLSIGEIYQAVVNDTGIMDHYVLIPIGKTVSFMNS